MNPASWLSLAIHATLHPPFEDSLALTSTLQIEYPKPDGKLTFDLLSSVALTGTNHEGDQGPFIDDVRTEDGGVGSGDYLVREVA